MLARTLVPLAAAAVLAVAVVPAGAATDDRTAVIGPGALAGGVDLSGQTIAQGAATLRTRLRAAVMAPVTVRIGAKRFQLGGARAGVRFDALRTARRAYYAARDAAPPAPSPPATPIPATPTPATTPTAPAAVRQGGGVTAGADPQGPRRVRRSRRRA
jgi:hypothetical protein